MSTKRQERASGKDWSVWNIRGEMTSVWFAKDGEVVVLGSPDNDESRPEDEWHNCDANGCGQDHVLWRGRIERQETP